MFILHTSTALSFRRHLGCNRCCYSLRLGEVTTLVSSRVRLNEGLCLIWGWKWWRRNKTRQRTCDPDGRYYQTRSFDDSRRWISGWGTPRNGAIWLGAVNSFFEARTVGNSPGVEDGMAILCRDGLLETIWLALGFEVDKSPTLGIHTGGAFGCLLSPTSIGNSLWLKEGKAR